MVKHTRRILAAVTAVAAHQWITQLLGGGVQAADIQSSTARLPGGFVSLWDELVSLPSAEEGEEEKTSQMPASAYCLIKSRTLTRAEQAQVLETLLSQEGEGELDLPQGVKTLGCTQNNRALCLAAPQSLADVASCTVATGGNVLFVPSTTDLERGEGLLGPKGELTLSMEQILLSPSLDGSLTVLVPNGVSVEKAQQALYDAVEPILGHLVASTNLDDSRDKPIATLSDVFGGGVTFVALKDAHKTLWTTQRNDAPNVITDLPTLLDVAAPYEATIPAAAASPADLAAARVLARKAEAIVEDCFETVSQVVQHEDGSGVKLVPAFGELCTAALHSAAAEWDRVCPKSLQQASPLAQQMRQRQVTEALTLQLSGLVSQQIELQFAHSLADFKKKISGVLVSPNLKQDMHDKVATPCLNDFRKAVQGLVFVSPTTEDFVGPAVAYFSRTLKQEVAQRLLKARASGKFRPLPRKGVTVGLHWLLPKPFGNDYRQEPWKVHATDRMVYLPPSSDGAGGVQEVAPGQVKQGDWRNQVVPSPVGNDLIYTQG